MDVFSEVLLSVFIAFVLSAFLVVSLGDVLKLLSLYSVPLSNLAKLGVSLVNVVCLLPVIIPTAYLLWFVTSLPLYYVMLGYVIFLSLTLASVDNRIAFFSSVLAVALAVFLSSVVLVLIALFILMARVLITWLQGIPQVLVIEKLRFATVSPRHVVFIVFPIVLFVVLVHMFGLQNLHIVVSVGVTISSVGGMADFLPLALAMAIATMAYFIAPFLNSVNRYIDAYIWYLRVLHRTPLSERVVKTLFHFAVTITVSLFVYAVVNTTGTIRVEAAMSRLALATLVGMLVLAKLERDRDLAVLLTVYLTTFIALSRVTLPHLNMAVFDIFLSTLLLTTAIALYDVPFRIKKFLSSGVFIRLQLLETSNWSSHKSKLMH